MAEGGGGSEAAGPCPAVSEIESTVTPPASECDKKSVAGSVSAEVQQLVKVQRRIRGVVRSVDPGNCTIFSEKYGVFTFDLRSVKRNKNHPDRKPQEGDPCEFRLSHLNPPTAVSIRVAVPKEKRTTLPISMDDAGVQKVMSLLEEHCTHVAPLTRRIESVELRLSIAVLQLFSHCLDLVESTRLPAPVKQMLLRDIPAFLNNPVLPIEVTTQHAAFFDSFPVIAEVMGQYVPDRQRNIIMSVLRTRGDGLASFQGREIMSLADHQEYRQVVGGSLSDGCAKLVDVFLGQRFNPQRASNSGRSVGAFVEKLAAITAFAEFECEGNTPLPLFAQNPKPLVSSVALAFDQSLPARCRSSRFPRDLWGYQFDPFGLMADPRGCRSALHSLNVLLEDALSHVADLLEFLSLVVDHPDIFSFFAVPSLLGIAFLVQMWGSPESFNAAGAMSPGAQVTQQTVEDIMAVDSPHGAAEWFEYFFDEFSMKIEEASSDMLAGRQSSQVLSALNGIVSSLRRMVSAIESHAPKAEETGKPKSLTRALLAEQGAALGGKLLYSIVDSLGKVFNGAEPAPAPPSSAGGQPGVARKKHSNDISEKLNVRGRIPLPAETASSRVSQAGNDDASVVSSIASSTVRNRKKVERKAKQKGGAALPAEPLSSSGKLPLPAGSAPDTYRVPQPGQVVGAVQRTPIPLPKPPGGAAAQGGGGGGAVASVAAPADKQQPLVARHTPYQEQPPQRGTMDFLTDVARGWLGYMPLDQPSSTSDLESFGSFYEGSLDQGPPRRRDEDGDELDNDDDPDEDGDGGALTDTELATPCPALSGSMPCPGTDPVLYVELAEESPEGAADEDGLARQRSSSMLAVPGGPAGGIYRSKTP